VTTYRIARINQPVADSVFTFTPPASAKLVDQIDMPGASEPVSPLVGHPAEEIALNDIAGKAQKLSGLKGRVVLLDFWATWCGPCRRELPTIVKLHKELTAQGLSVVAVNVGEDPATVKQFLTQNNYQVLPVWLDPNHQAASAYGAQAIPTLVVIDKNGTVIDHKAGLHDEAALRAMLKKAGLAGPVTNAGRSAAKSTLPPDRMTPMRCAPDGARPPSSAARPSTPVGSTTSFSRVHANCIASSSAVSGTLVMSATCCRMSGKRDRPERRLCARRRRSCRAPGIVTSRPSRNERPPSSPAAGSTPTTRHPGDAIAAASAVPEASPPPPDRGRRAHRAARPRRTARRRGRGAGDDVGMIERRHERETALVGQPLRERFAPFAPRIVVHDLGAVLARGVELGARRGARHDDDAATPRAAGTRARRPARGYPTRTRRHRAPPRPARAARSRSTRRGT
jgi:thiol-disulfide isomerase/thioredoxin